MYNYQTSWHTQIDLCACVLKLPASVDAVYYAYCTAIWFWPSCIYSSQGTCWCYSEFTPDCTRVAPSPMYAQLQPPRMAHMDGRLALNARQNAQKSDNFNLALQTVPFSIIKKISLFLPPLMGYVEEFTFISFFCDSDSHRLYVRLHWLRPIMWILCCWQDVSASI